jgi:phosphoglycolate phosphatase-like HAD superfamily hydrolase
LVKPVAVLFDIDGTLITTGGAGARSWRDAFQDLYGIPADIGRFTDAGMTDPEVGRLTFVGVIGRDPTPEEMTALMAKRLAHLPRAVAESQGYRVLDGVEETLGTLSEQGFLLGLTTGGVDAAAHIKLARAGLNHYFCFGGYGSDSRLGRSPSVLRAATTARRNSARRARTTCSRRFGSRFQASPKQR